MKQMASFFLFGLFVGNLCGLSESPVAMTLVPLLFTFAGGSIMAFYGKMEEAARRGAVSGLGAASLGGLVGTYLAIVLVTTGTLGPERTFADGSTGVLRSADVAAIEVKLRLMEQGALEPADAAAQIRELLHEEFRDER